MKISFKLAPYSQGLMILLSACVISACSRPSSDTALDSRGKVAPEETGATAESKEVEELAAKIEGYQKQIDSSGNVITLPGYEPTPLQQDDGVLSAKDIATNSEKEIFSYDPPPQVDAEFSHSLRIAEGAAMPTDVTEECQGREFSQQVPKLGQLPKVSGSFFYCIRLTHSSTQKQFYLKTPPIIVVVTKTQLKLLSEDCVDPDLSQLASSIELTMCDGSLGKGTYVAPVLPAYCTADGQSGCVNTGNYKSADTAAFGSGDLKTGKTVAGVAGSLANCAADGATGCVAIATYKAAKMADFDATKILTGTTIAGVGGSATPAPADCGTDGATNCVAVAAYKAAKMADFDATKIRSGTTIAGVGGSIADCSSNGQDTCFLNTANSYDAANLTNLSAGNIKSSVVIAGVTGDYPSGTYPLPGASGGVADLSAPIDAQIKSATAFEFWDSTGSRYVAAGDADITAAKIKDLVDIFGAVGTVVDPGVINAWDVRVGVTIGSTTGALKVNCRNAINSTRYNSDSMPPGTAATTAGSAADWWDTIEDYNIAGVFPTTLVSGWTSDTHCDATNWQDMTNNGSGDTTCDSAGDECVFKDKISGLLWSEQQSGSDWSAAVNLCNGLNSTSFGGYSSGWRLPTQKELMEAYTHGIRDLGYIGGTAGTTSNNDNFIAGVDSWFWSSSSSADDTTHAWYVILGYGYTTLELKTTWYDVVCVR